MIQRAIDSVKAQTFQDWELVIVDDGSTDNTKALVATVNDARCRYVYQENQERCVARNKGISIATGLYIGFLDSDDFFLPDHLEGFRKEIEKRNYPVAMLVTGIFVEDKGKRIEHVLYDDKTGSPLRFAWRSVILPGAVCLHREILSKYKFNEKLYIWEDRHLWLRVLTEYPLIQIPQYSTVLYEHRNRSTNIFYKNLSIPALKIYFKSMQDLINSHGHFFRKEFTDKELQKFVTEKYIIFLQVAVKNAQVKESFFLLQRVLRSNPAFILTPFFFKMLFLIPVNKLIRHQSDVVA